MNSHIKTIHLSVGEIIVAESPVIIATVLGSCVSVCIFDEKKSLGGMNHYALPAASECIEIGQEYRYADHAITALVNEITERSGLEPSELKAKIVGGALEIGKENIEAARDILNKFGIEIVGEAVGGELGRKALFHVPSGRLQVAKVDEKNNKKIEGRVGRPSITKPLEESRHAATPKADLSKKRKVLIVDDSKTIRDLLARILREDQELEIIGQAADANEAARIVAKNKPDVITLDIHMPIMTGVQWLEKLLPTNPIPVVMISSLQLQEGNEVFRALELGAVDYIQKPTLSELARVGPIIREKVKEASFAKVIRHSKTTTASFTQAAIDTNYILAMGASTGGTEALKSVLCALPERIPPIVIVQHIPPVFSKTFADRMNELCSFEVKEAEDKDELKKSRVLIAPGGKQMKLQKTTSGYCVRITDDPPVNRHKPSVDYLFNSVATLVGRKAIGVILTGMGNDGAKGLLAMRQNGARTIGQDEDTSVVYGMPRVAFQVGAVEKVSALSDVPRLILSFLENKKAA